MLSPQFERHSPRGNIAFRHSLPAGIVDRRDTQLHRQRIHCRRTRKLGVPPLLAELPRLSHKVSSGIYCIFEDIAAAAINRNLAVVVEQLNPEKEIAGQKVVWRFIEPDFIRPMPCKGCRYRSVLTFGDQAQLHMRLEQQGFKIHSNGSLAHNVSFPVRGCRPAITDVSTEIAAADLSGICRNRGVKRRYGR